MDSSNYTLDMEITTTSYNENQGPNTNSIELIIVASVICCFAMLIYTCIATHKKLKLKKLKQEQMQPSDSLNCIQNALTVIIAIGDYQDADECTSPDLKHAFLKDLPIDKDIDNLTELFTLLNYKIIPDKPKTYWTENDIMSLLQNDIPNELFDENKILKYDGLIVCISCHGTENRIITSDMKVIDKIAIHRIISGNHAEAREIPRIFLFDSCEGDSERIRKRSTSIDDIEMNEIPIDTQYLSDAPLMITEIGKHVALEHIENGTQWTTTTKNPDYRLIEVHASNPGFQAKIDSRHGSFLMNEFSQRMIENIKNEKQETLSDIFSAIQTSLHDRGKQQTRNVFNNQTRYLQLRVKES
eukprot:141184_1